MRHRVSGHQFNRDSNARKGLILSLVSNLAIYGAITTTRPMAKEAARHMEKLITKAKKGDLASRRVLHRFFGKRKLVNLMVDQIAPTFADKNSGFTVITALGERRGDSTPL
ncbi:50S ribosomal protein L17, partial [Microgenomates group bacterium]|nr:50S ribosomal protein L17 [Microgenomates group bacterium]